MLRLTLRLLPVAFPAEFRPESKASNCSPDVFRQTLDNRPSGSPAAADLLLVPSSPPDRASQHLQSPALELPESSDGTILLPFACNPLSAVRSSVLYYRTYVLGIGVPCSAGIAPYMAIELAVFDLLPGDMPAFARGFSAALIATSVCYPMDTLRWVASCVGRRVLYLCMCRL